MTGMPPPLPILATHLIQLIIPDVTGQDEDFGQVPDYTTTPITYIGIVEQSAGIETDAGQIYSVGTFDVVIFSIADPGLLGPSGDPAIPTQTEVRWGKLPQGYVLPMSGVNIGTVTAPMGWTPEKVGMAEADGTALDYGCWKVGVKAKS